MLSPAQQPLISLKFTYYSHPLFTRIRTAEVLAVPEGRPEISHKEAAKNFRQLARPVNENQTIFIQAVRAADSLPLAVREQAAAVRFFERRTFDASYLNFLREQIDLGARGPEWTARSGNIS
jgi:hypothetical protein